MTSMARKINQEQTQAYVLQLNNAPHISWLISQRKYNIQYYKNAFLLTNAKMLGNNVWFLNKYAITI